MRSRFLPVATLSMALLLVGCADLRARVPGMQRQPAFTQEELRAELAHFAALFRAGVNALADTIMRESDDRAMRRRALIFRMRTIPAIQQASLDPNPQESYIEMLTFVELLKQHVQEGGGRDDFGPFQPLLIEATDRFEERIVEIGELFLTPEQLEQVLADVKQFARARPIQGDFALQQVQKALIDVEQTGVFQSVVAVPLSPFRALSGAGDTPAAIREFTAAAREAVRAVEILPEQTRWEIELLLYDVEDRDTLKDLMVSLDSLAQTGQALSLVADELPEDLRMLLGESNDAMVRLERSLESARLLSTDVQAAADSLQLAGSSLATLFARDDGGEPGRPFDIREYQATAQEIGRSSDQLRSLLAEAHALAQDGSLEGAVAPVGATIDLADARARSLVDLAAWRVLQLIVVLFVLLVLYRLLSARLARS